VEPSFPVFAFAPPGATWPSISETLRKLHGLHAEIAVITETRNAQAAGARHAGNPRAGAPRRGNDAHSVIPAQLLAACLASQKGLNPDRPRTLSKVTLTL
jgi:glucosamine--fructose-6-phosphate aminotransferase (isomerizing)